MKFKKILMLASFLLILPKNVFALTISADEAKALQTGFQNGQVLSVLELTALERQVQNVLSQITGGNPPLLTLQDRINEMRLLIPNSNGGPLLTALVNMNNNLNQATANFNAANSNFIAVAQQLQDVYAALTEKTTDLATANAALSAANAAKAQAEGKLAAVNAALMAANAEKDQSDKQVQGAQAALATKMTELTTANSNLSSLQSGLGADINALAGLVDGTTGGVIATKLTSQRDSIKTSQTSVQSAITAVNAALGGSGTTHERAQAVKSDLSMAQNDLATANAAKTQAESNLAAANSNLSSLRSGLVITPGATVNDDIDALAGVVDGTTDGVIATKIENQRDSIKASESSVLSAIDAVNNALGGSGTTHDRTQALSNALSGSVAQSLNDSVSNANTALDDSVASLPGGVSYLTVTEAANADNAPYVSIKLGGVTYSISMNSVSIFAQRSFSLLNGHNTLTIYNRFASTIDSDQKLKNYLNSMYPTGAKISTTISDKTASLKVMVGGNQASLRARIAFLNQKILNTPTGVLGDDLNTARGKLVNALGNTLEGDIESLLNRVSLPSTGTLSSNIDNVSSQIDDRVISLPIGVLTLSVSSAAIINDSVVQIVLSENFSNQTYTFNGSSFPITNNSQFLLTNGTKTLVLKNKSGGNITNASSLITYLNSAYPVNAVFHSAISGKISDINTAFGGSGTTYERAQALSNALSGSVAQSLNNSVSNANSALDNSVASLPGGVSYLTVTESANADNAACVSIKLGGVTYSIQFSSIINNNVTFSLANGSNTLPLRNVSGNPIGDAQKTSQDNAQVLANYLNSMYPTGAKISTTISDKTSSLMMMVGGSQASLRARIAFLNQKILYTPTGVLGDDLNTARGKLVNALGNTLEGDIGSIKSILWGDPNVADSVQSLIGTPLTINGTASSIKDVIGGSVTNSNIDHSLFVAFDGANNINDKLLAFISIFSNGNLISPGQYFSVPQGSYNSLAEILNSLTIR